MTDTVLAAYIAASSQLISTLVAAIAAAVIGRQFHNMNKLREKLSKAVTDIEFLLHVEAAHCELNISEGTASQKNTIRNMVKDIGCTWSGKFTYSTISKYQIKVN